METVSVVNGLTLMRKSIKSLQSAALKPKNLLSVQLESLPSLSSQSNMETG